MKKTTFRLALFAGAALAPLALATDADAQTMNVRRSQMARSTETAAATMARADEQTRALFDAQRTFRAANGRFATLAELPEVALTTSFISFSSGRDFYVVLAGTLEDGIVQDVVTIEPAEASAPEAQAGSASGG